MAEERSTEPLVRVTPDQILRELKEVMEKYPSMACIVLIGPLGDASRLACQTNVSKGATRERLQNGLKQLSEGRIHIPFRD